MKPIECKIQNCYSQTGVENDFCVMWKYGAGESVQTAYQINIFRQDTLVFSTGRVISNEQNHIELHCDFDEQTRYCFTVTVWDEDGEEYESDPAEFITGVHKWRGEWIGNGTKKPFLAKKKFWFHGGSAVLSVCVPGQYEVRMNDRKISPYVYEGSQTDFSKHIHYCTYDVARYMKDGENELTIECANGWYIGDDDAGRRYFYTMNAGYEPFGECLSVIAQLKLDGGYVVTDTTWEVSRSRTVLADIYGSEDMDYTIEYEWSLAKKAAPPQGKRIPCHYPPVIHKYCYEPKAVDKKRMIFDFGQNMSSQFCLTIKGARGQKVKLIPSEKLKEDGDIEQTTDTYSLLVLSGKEDTFEQKFSVNGARWYKVEGAEYGQIIAFHSCFTTSSAADCGRFRCSDERLNKIYMLILKAIESNLNHLHTDCPTIEKLGWLEPNHLMARAVMYNKEVDTLWSKIAMDMRDAQYGKKEYDRDTGKCRHEYKSGLIPSIAPRYAKFLYDSGEGSFWDIIPWGSSVILAAYEQYLFYGNRQIMEENYDAAKKYMAYLTEQYKGYHRLYGKKGEDCFICAGLGDWGIEQNRGRSRENIETAFYYHDLMVMAEISALLGKGDESAFISLAECVKERYNASLLTDEGYRDYRTREITQANQAIPLCFGMVPEEYKTVVQDVLVGACEGKHLECGEIGLVYILRSLSAAGRNDIIYEMILKDTHPSYLRFVENGETTLPEFWRDDARSRNHDMMGHIMEWFFTDIAGITSDDGFQKVKIEPKCTAFLEEFECEYDSVRGKIRVCIKDGRTEISVPCNVTLLTES